MKLLHIKTINAALSQNIDIPQGNFRGLFLESSLAPVEWATGVAGTFNATVMVKGGSKQNPLIKDLFPFNKYLLGMPTYTVSSGTGTGGDDAITLALDLPFEVPEFKNSLNVQSNSAVVLNYNSGNCKRGTLELYGVLQDMPQSYCLRYGRLTETGAGLQHFYIPVPNCVKLFIEPRAVTDRIEVKVDGILVDNATGTPLLEATQLYGIHETGVMTVVGINLAPSASMSEGINRNVEVSIEHGVAGTTTVHFYAMDFGAPEVPPTAIQKARTATLI